MPSPYGELYTHARLPKNSPARPVTTLAWVKIVIVLTRVPFSAPTRYFSYSLPPLVPAILPALTGVVKRCHPTETGRYDSLVVALQLVDIAKKLLTQENETLNNLVECSGLPQPSTSKENEMLTEVLQRMNDSARVVISRGSRPQSKKLDIPAT